jgi:predicted membrane protein
LRRQAHPNFVRWSICNGNPARVLFARCLGVGLIIGGFVIAVILTLSGIGRGYRVLAAIAWVLGISTLIAAYKGMCVVLHGMHHRHVRPWELFDQTKELGLDDVNNTKLSFESFGSSNSYEDEPWVVKYQRRNVARKIFDREVWIQEPALRQIQDVIFIQSLVGSVIAGGILAGVFVALPSGGFF